MNDKRVEPMDKVSKLFNDAAAEHEEAVIDKYKDEVKVLLDKRKAAAKILANVDREMDELKLKIRHEIDAGS